MANATSGPARVRPAVVTYAVYLLYLLAALQVISAVIQLSIVGTYKDVVTSAYAGTDASGAISGVMTATTIGGAIIGLLFAAGYVLLGIFDGKGKRVARIITWVVLGIGLCCGGLGLAGAASGGFGGSNSSGQGPSAEELQSRIEAALPSWYGGTTLALGIIGLLAGIGAIILLALPASNVFFSKVEPVWEPPAPGGAAWGAQPGGSPAYPQQAGQQPGYPPQGQSGYPPQSQPGYPPQQPGYPPQGQPGYPPQQPGYPQSGEPPTAPPPGS